MSGSNRAPSNRIEELEEKIEGLKTKVKVHEDRADEWMELYKELEDKYNELNNKEIDEHN
tara:strand:+ start:47 stop:226 length:180 start_codon:yes stop_codon:yes gene_type:complete